jgi:hypothetical protein
MYDHLIRTYRNQGGDDGDYDEEGHDINSRAQYARSEALITIVLIVYILAGK